MIDPDRYIVHDLTLPLDQRVAGFSSEPARDLRKDGWNATWLRIYSHAGTHMDAPWHFEVNEGTIDQYAPARFLSHAWVVDLPVSEDRSLLTVADLGQTADLIEPGDSLLLRTGWSRHLGQARYRDGLPRLSEALATWLVDRKVNILGVEPPSVADVNDLPEVTAIHEILLAGDVIIVEGLTGLEEIAAEEVTLIATPLKVVGCDGAPARVLALEEKMRLE